MRFLASFQVSFPVLQVSSYCVLEIVKHSPRSILPREFSLQKDSVVTKISSGWGEHAFDWGRWAGQGILTEILGRRHVPDVPPPSLVAMLLMTMLPWDKRNPPAFPLFTCWRQKLTQGNVITRATRPFLFSFVLLRVTELKTKRSPSLLIPKQHQCVHEGPLGTMSTCGKKS